MNLAQHIRLKNTIVVNIINQTRHIQAPFNIWLYHTVAPSSQMETEHYDPNNLHIYVILTVLPTSAGEVFGQPLRGWCRQGRWATSHCHSRPVTWVATTYTRHGWLPMNAGDWQLLRRWKKMSWIFLVSSIYEFHPAPKPRHKFTVSDRPWSWWNIFQTTKQLEVYCVLK